MELSVVLPTRNRAGVLLHTLERLGAQTPPPGGFEIVVVDNGSTDETPETLREAQAQSSVALHALREPRPGPAAARNAGVRRASGRVVLFLGDDMAPAGDGLVAGHARFHAQSAEPRGLLGRVTWDGAHPVTPFMHWLENGGPQFRFAALDPGPVDTGSYFYTSNVSLPRATLDAVGGFDERFPYAAVEDMELGVRLRAHGLQLHYDPSLLVLHDHPTELAGSLRRLGQVGESARAYASLHPDEPLRGLPEPKGALWSAVQLLAPVARVVEPVPLPSALRKRVWFTLHLHAYAAGYRRGLPAVTS
jgi:GT2 family glycosyltransferase